MLIVERAAVIGIHLVPAPNRELRVGTLIRDKAGTVTFVVDDGYIAMGPRRPLVSLAWQGRSEDETTARLTNRGDKIMHGGLLPPFFENLLPEGALRELVAKEFGAGNFDNFDVLGRLGQDLPGAVVARWEAGTKAPTTTRAERVEVPETSPRIRFSVAGVQLKFSMTMKHGSLTIPAVDNEGEIILKTPARHYERVPEAEYIALKLAEAVGVRVVDAWLVDADQIDGIPVEFLPSGAKSLAVRRFDRHAEHRRTQIEDFAQILGAVGNQKYTKGNEATVMNIVHRFSADPRGELLEAVRRIVVNILIGNGDAHLKNWSFLYPDAGDISLSPAYDLVPTFLYGDDDMALPFGNNNNPYTVGTRRFERAAGLLKVDPKLLVKEVRLTVEKALDIWPGLLKDLPLTSDANRPIINRLDKLQLVREIRDET
ncbi:type II toxin-antitoxin system HipA family toxin [Phyllobacterium brassicacearum]|nr:HipA domain-containing protein [Phyllobacterium brassicacearum]TDQ14848.1 serine/threonine-protein kinase HipA [Phyllobacterium brassicacearum]